MPYPCNHFYFDIKFGHRLYSGPWTFAKTTTLASSLLNIICRQIWYQSKSDYLDRALGSQVRKWKILLTFWTYYIHAILRRGEGSKSPENTVICGWPQSVAIVDTTTRKSSTAIRRLWNCPHCIARDVRRSRQVSIFYHIYCLLPQI